MNRDTMPLRSAQVLYQRRGGTVSLLLHVIVPNGGDWQTRARTVAHIVGELHFQMYDLEREG